MKPTLCCLLILIASSLVLPACISVKDELFLRNIDIEGSPSQPPVHVTSAAREIKSVYVSPSMSISSGSLSTTLDKQFVATIPDSLPDFKKTGLSWNLPRFTLGLDIDYAATQSLSLNGAITASIAKNKQFTSFYGGIGLVSADSVTSLRLDIGVQYIDIQYSGATVILRTIGTGPQDTIYYLDRGKEYQFNLYASLTLNSSRPDLPLGWFFQLGISPQSLTRFVPTNDSYGIRSTYVVSDQRAESSVFWVTATPGLYFSLPGDRRLLLGVRLMREVLSESSKPGIIVIPMVQFDWRL
ncbi:MAG: hypothetical protein WEB37_13640 [Bacteroidota bacterium]